MDARCPSLHTNITCTSIIHPEVLRSIAYYLLFYNYASVSINKSITFSVARNYLARLDDKTINVAFIFVQPKTPQKYF